MVRAIVAFVFVVSLLLLGAWAVPSISVVAADSLATTANAKAPQLSPHLPSWGRGFTQNLGQLADSHVRFYSSSMWPQVGFAPNEVVFVLAEGRTSPRAVLVRAVFENANPVEPIGIEKLSYSTNFLHGGDLARSHVEVPSYGQVAYRGLYEGIDLVYAATPSGTKYEFFLASAASAAEITIRFDGADSIQLDAAGNLVIHTEAGDLVDGAPTGDQQGRPVECGFILRDISTAGYRCAGADAALPLRIDPLIYATYMGSTGVDQVAAVVADAGGNAYVTGSAGGSDFPTTVGAFDRTFGGGCDSLSCADAFVAKLNPSGTGLVYATFLGGSGYDKGNAIAVDGSGHAYIVGETYSSDFPTTPGAFERTYHGQSDVFIAKLNVSGDALDFSTLLGGTSWDYGSSIAVDSAGGVHVTGHSFSSEFPTTVGAFNRTFLGVAAFASMLNSTGSALVYSTFIGDGQPYAIQVDAVGNAYVAGDTSDRYFPTTPGALKTTFTTRDGFITKLNPSGSGLVYSTFFGGNLYDYVYALSLDSSGDAFMTGTTNSSDFPFTPGAWNTTFPHPTRGGYVYVAELNMSGSSLNYATFIGGTKGLSFGNAIAVDSTGNAFVVGSTFDTDFPTTPGAIQPSHQGDPSYSDSFISELSSAGNTLLDSTYLGGSYGDTALGVALDPSSNVYVSGGTSSLDFPVTQGAFDTTPNVNYTTNSVADGFLVKLGSLTGPLTYKTTVDTGPTGLQVEVNGTAYTAPFAFWCVSGSTVWMNATSPQLVGSYQYWFSSWSDGGVQDHTITCAPGVYLAAYYTRTPQPDFVLLASPSRTGTAPGGNATVDLTVLGLNGYAGSIVTLSLSGAPPGVSGTFSPTFVAPSGTATLTLAVASTVAPGVYPLSIRGNNGSAVRSVPFQLEVLGLQLAANTTALAIATGNLGSASVSVTLKGNYTNPVVLSVSGLPAGVGVSLTTAQFFASGVATLTFIVAPNAIAGTYPVAVLAAGGGVTRAVSLDLRVLAGGSMALPIAPSEWASLLGWFLAAAAVSAAIIYAIERKKK
jgi:hypothetical protein